MPTTRLAPSPTGALHLGNARTFLVNWALAKQCGWRVVLRIDDLDGPRIKEGATELAIDTLRWLGLAWDEGPYFQSNNRTAYRDALLKLIRGGHAYPCRCTRSEILAASLSAPHAGEHDVRYGGTCRPAEGAAIDESLLGDPRVAWRIRTPDEPITFEDALLGRQAFNPQQEVGDFLVTTKGGEASYQLAVVIDDRLQGVDRIVRGDDLLSSTARQLLVARLLGDATASEHTHVPLVIGQDGRRLAKRHGDTRVDSYRRLGVPPERVLGLLARWCGVEAGDELTAAEFADRFDLQRLPREHVVFTADDDRWLRRDSAGS